jgi:bacterioferritin
MELNSLSKGIFDGDSSGTRERVVELLTRAYWMEIETVMSYLGHARQFADRIKELYGVVPGSEGFRAEQSFLQPPEHQTDTVHVIRGVIKAETGAIEHYTRIIEETDQVDPVTQDMVIAILRDEQSHRRLFEGFLREYEFEGIA